MKILLRVGSMLLAVGLILVIAVAAVWIGAPIATPPQQPSTLDPSTSLAAPALSTIEPVAAESQQWSISAPQDDGSSVPIPTSTPSTAESPPSTLDPTHVEPKSHAPHERQPADDFFRVSIPALDIDVPVVPVGLQEKLSSNGRVYNQWAVPNAYAVGWHDSSALPGQTGNTVLNGHNNVYGAVFSDLVDLTLGDQIILYREEQQHVYQIIHREFMPERGEPLRTRLRNARWILPTDDMRLTLVTCWPNTTNTHRLVIVAEALAPTASH